MIMNLFPATGLTGLHKKQPLPATLDEFPGYVTRVIYPNAESGDDTWKTSEVTTKTGDTGTGSVTASGEPSNDDEAIQVWEVRISGGPSGTIYLYLDGILITSTVIDASGYATLTHNGVTISVLNVEDDDNFKWTYTKQKTLPQLELRYEYAQGGQLSRVSYVDQTATETAQYGPERYVVEYKYDNMGRLVNKVVRDTPLVQTDTAMQGSSERYESDYQYDGRGRLERERILRYDTSTGRMAVTQDIQTTFDLGDNPTEIRVYDDYGLAYTETRTYAKGYQLTNATFVGGSGVSAVESGSFTYDTNNNLTGTKGISITRSGNYLAYRAAYTFTYDRKNRLKTYRLGDTTTHIWWDGLGRVWQRWDYDEGEETWSMDVFRYVYDGMTLVQEHKFNALHLISEPPDLEAWAYMYMYLIRDYLHQQGGIRQRESDDGSTFTDRQLMTDRGVMTARVDKDTKNVVKRMELTSSLERQVYGSEQDTQLSNLLSSGMYIETFASTSGASAYFDPLIQQGQRHYLASYTRMLNRVGNNPYFGFFGGSGGIGGIEIEPTSEVDPELSIPPLPFVPFPEDEMEYWANDPANADDPRRCPPCCLEALFIFFKVTPPANTVYNLCTWQYPTGNKQFSPAFLKICCGAVSFLANMNPCPDDPEMSMGRCRSNCCLMCSTDIASFVSTAVIEYYAKSHEYVGNIIEIIQGILNKLGLTNNCFIDCLVTSLPSITIFDIIACIYKCFEGQVRDKALDALSMIFSAVPGINSNAGKKLCESLASRIGKSTQDEYISNNYDNIYACCVTNYDKLMTMKDPTDIYDFTNAMRCCLMAQRFSQ